MMRPLSCKQRLVGIFGTLLLGSALLAAPAGAQTAAPAPADAPPAPAVDTSADANGGTTIIGDRESPIGLYLTPWKNELADRDMDRAAQFVRGDLAPIDPQVFDRQIQYYDRISAYRQNELAGKK